MNILRYQFHEKRGKLLVPIIVYALLGMCVEVIWTALTGGDILLMGHTSLWMIPTYAIGFTCLNILNDIQSYYKLPMIIQTLFGGLVIIMIEFISGLVIVKLFGIQAWDYSYQKYNIMGIISMTSYISFTISIPFGIWLVDIVDWLIYRNDTRYSLMKNYYDIVKWR